MTKVRVGGESPLYMLLNQINAAAQNGLDLLAIGMAVALPEYACR